jgi:hypothetical protein
MFVALIIGGLMVVVFRIYKTNTDYETARQVNEFVKAVDKGLFMMNAILQSSSFRNPDASTIEGDNGGLYLMVSDTSFDSLYKALMNGDCMVRCFDNLDSNNSECGGNAADFNGMCQSGRLCLMGILGKRYLNTYMIPKVLQGRVSFYAVPVKNSYEVVVDSKTGQKITAGQLVKLTEIRMDLTGAESIIPILQNMDSRYVRVGGSVLAYSLNNSAGHLVIVRNGYRTDCRQYCWEQGLCTIRNVCPSGYTFNSSTGKCEATPICPSGFTFNSSTGRCETNPSCPSGFTFNSSTGRCETTPSCSSGYTFNSSRGRCEATPICPSGYTFNLFTGKCETTPSCSSGYTFNSSTGRCEAAPICPSGFTFNPSTGRCETNPICPSGSSWHPGIRLCVYW